ncbi:hypothetical protein Prudu_000660, partial [Prunus dulcis]
MEKNAELERGVPRLVINYKPLNSVLEWIRYPIPNKRDLINRLGKAVVFSKFDMKVWNVMPFGLKNAPSEFQNIMNDIFNPYSHFSIVYIDDVLIFSESVEQHWKHLYQFLSIVKKNGLVVLPRKSNCSKSTSDSLISPIDRVIQFAEKFPDQFLIRISSR